MQIYCILLVKDEADIIEEILRDSAGWADKIVVIDNMSQDGTWEIVQSLASEVVVPWNRTSERFHPGLRADAFEAFRSEVSEGDWWCRMDADEFYLDDPRSFLSSVPHPYHCVFKRSVDYVLTEEDSQSIAFERGFANYRCDLRHILPVCQTEPRFFRHRKTLRWPRDEWFPINRGPKYSKSILVRHYQYRSPQQIQHRLDARNAIPKDEQGKPFKHVTQTHWREVLYSPERVFRDDAVRDFRALPLYNSSGDQNKKDWVKWLGRKVQFLAYYTGLRR